MDSYARPTRLPLWILLPVVALALIGGWGIWLRIVQGMGGTNLTGPVTWGIWVAFYIFSTGLSAGAFILATSVYVFKVRWFERVGRLALFTALIVLFTGLMFIALDLGHMERFITVYTHLNPYSVLTWEILLYLVYILVLVGQLWFLMRADFVSLRDQVGGRLRGLYRLLALGTADISEAARKRDLKAVFILGLIGLPITLGVPGGSGAIFAVAKARPYWFSGLIPIVFIVSGLVAGMAALTFLYALIGDRRDRDHKAIVRSLGLIASALLTFDLVLLLSEVLVGMYSGVPHHTEIFEAMMHGPYAWVFWGGQITVGAVIPLTLMWLPKTGNKTWVMALAGFLMCVGIIAVRLNIVIPSLTIPMLPGIHDAFVDLRVSPFYFPSWMEILSSLGVFGINALFFMVGVMVLPLNDRRLARFEGEGEDDEPLTEEVLTEEL